MSHIDDKTPPEIPDAQAPSPEKTTDTTVDDRALRSKTLSVKVPETVDEEIDRYADDRGKTKSWVVREAIREYFVRAENARGPSVLSLAEDLAGSVEAEPDLSTNPEHMEGYGR